MSIVAIRSTSVVETCAALVGALSLLVACGGTEPGTSPGSGGDAPGGAGMSSSGTGGSTFTGGSGGSPASGGTGAIAGMPSGGVGGTSSGAGGVNGGTTGASAGSGGMTGGSGGTAGAPSMGGAGAGGTGSPGGSGGSQALSFRTDIFPVFAMTRDPAFVYPGGSTFESCTTTGVCHGGVRPGAGLQMIDADMAYGELFGAASTTELCNGTTRVIAGNPAESCLILFYEGRLRDELDWVEDTEIDLVRRWIAEGALP